MDDELRIEMWNYFYIYILDELSNNSIRDLGVFFMVLWVNFFKHPIDEFPEDFRFFLKNWFFNSTWYEVYDFLEFVIQLDRPLNKEEAVKTCNNILERNLSAYRLVGNKFLEITDQVEINAIEEALNTSEKAGIDGAFHHLQTALRMLSDRRMPDYRNSIKESISSVEAVCKFITSDKNATLGQALNKIESKIQLHPALKHAFSSLYGYTSYEDGIRHAMIDENKVDFEDAKYMLVSCSAFVHYLIHKANRAGVCKIR